MLVEDKTERFVVLISDYKLILVKGKTEMFVIFTLELEDGLVMAMIRRNGSEKKNDVKRRALIP